MKSYKRTMNGNLTTLSKVKLFNNLRLEVGTSQRRAKSGYADIIDESVLETRHHRGRRYFLLCPHCRLIMKRTIYYASRTTFRDHLLNHRVMRALNEEETWVRTHVTPTDLWSQHPIDARKGEIS